MHYQNKSSALKLFLLVALVGAFQPPIPAIADINELIKLKPGLWENELSNPIMPKGMKSKMCVGENSGEGMVAGFDKLKDRCQAPVVKRSGEVTTITVECDKNADEKYGVDITLTGDEKVQSALRTNDPKVGTMKSSGRYLGPCRAGEKPGDMIMIGPDGKETNIGNIAEMVRSLGGAALGR